MIGSINIFGRELGIYAIMALIGGLLAGFIAYRKARKNGLDEVTMIIMTLFGMIGVLVGGHLLYGITNIHNFGLFALVEDFDSFIAVVSFLFGGQVFYGGLIGGMIAVLIYAKVTKLESFGGYADIYAAGVPLFHCFGRIGCFLGGCCYGIESDFGFTFHNSLIEQANGVNRFPVQLFEAGFNLILFFVFWTMMNRGILKNRLFIVYLAVYAVGRFILEFFRGDTYRGFLFGLSTSQIIAVMMIVFVVVFMIIDDSKRRKTT